MKLLTRIRLINWHYLEDVDIPVEGSLYFFGKNETGKSSILDALQFVLVANLQRVHFNASAQGVDSDRNLTGYILCKVGEKYRYSDRTSYVALEFTDDDESPFIIGVVADAHEQADTKHTFYIINDQAMDDGLFFDQGRRPYKRTEFIARMRERRGATAYVTTTEYQNDLRNRLGQLNDRFFDLFVKAFSFKPVGDIRSFVYEFVLDAQPLDIEAMQATRERLKELQAMADRVRRQLVALQKIRNLADERLRLERLQLQHRYLVTRAQQEAAQQDLDRLHRELLELTDQIEQLQAQRALLETEVAQLEVESQQVQTTLNQDVRFVERRHLEEQRLSLRQNVASLKTQRDALLSQLRAAARTLGSVFDGFIGLLDDDAPLTELARFQKWTSGLPEALSDEAETEARIRAAREALAILRERAVEERAKLQVRTEDLRQKATEVDRRLREIQAGAALSPPQEAEKLRTLLSQFLGYAPKFLYEYLDVPDESWQNAVEGTLGRRRFDLLVPPEHFGRCVALYEHDGRRLGIHGVRLVDVARIRSERYQGEPRGLAGQVETDDRDARAYVDHLLGEWTTCETSADLSQHRRAITRTCMTYSNYAADHLDPRVYNSWYLGSRARIRQIEQLRAELDDLQKQLVELNGPLQLWQRRLRDVEVDEYTSWLSRLPQIFKLSQLQKQLTEVEERLTQTDWGDIAAQERRLEALKQALVQRRSVLRSCRDDEVKFQERRERAAGGEPPLQQALCAACETVQQSESQLSDDECAEFRVRYEEERRRGSYERIAENFERQARGYDTQIANLTTSIQTQQQVYQSTFNFQHTGELGEVSPFVQELKRLEATDLPRYEAEIERAYRDAEHEFREHFIHRLREKIREARYRLDQLNEALKRVTFSGTSYRFIFEQSPEYRHFYDLIVEQASDALGMPLLEGLFYEQHQAIVDELFEKLTLQAPGVSQKEVEGLCDYRSYLTYDIELRQEDGRRERFSKVGKLQSGGKTQAPYYVAMVAAFADLYRVLDPRRNDTVRLIVFDEAFNRMDRENTQAALDLMRQYRLQVITATPPKRFDEIAPYMQTNVLINRIGTQVVLTPYYREPHDN